MSGVIAGTAAIGGALISSSAASSAAGAQTSALEAGQKTQQQSLQQQLALQQQALTQQQAQYTENVAMEQPYMDAGAGALSEYDQLLGIQPVAAAGTPAPAVTPTSTSGGAQPAINNAPVPTAVGSTPAAPAMDPNTGLPVSTATAAGTLAQQQMGALANTPGYQFELQQGEQAISNGMSNTTGALSSAENKAMTNYAEGLAGTTYNSFMDRLNGVNTEGQQAASQTVAAGQANSNAQSAIVQGETNATANTGNNVSQLQAGVGAAQASGYAGIGSAATGAANSIGQGALLSSLVNPSGSSGGGLTAEEMAIQPPTG